MAKNRNLWVVEDNTENVDFRVTLAGDPFDLTGLIVEFLIKDSAKTPVSEASTLTSNNISEVELTDPDQGVGVVHLPLWATAETISGNRVYRLDLVNNGQRTTLAYGELLVRNT